MIKYNFVIIYTERIIGTTHQEFTSIEYSDIINLHIEIYLRIVYVSNVL